MSFLQILDMVKPKVEGMFRLVHDPVKGKVVQRSKVAQSEATGSIAVPPWMECKSITGYPV